MGKAKLKKKSGSEQAVCVLEGYLTAAQIAHTATPDGISVQTTSGGQVHVVFSNETEQPIQTGSTISLNPDLLLKREHTMTAFHEVTDAAGYGRPIPVARGPEPEGIVNDFFLVSIRHRDLRTVPNPPAADLAECKKIADDVSRAFFYKYRWLCETKGYTVDDLSTYALLWSTIWLGKYKRTRKDADSNGKLLRYHLKQRFFGEFSLRLQRDAPLYNIDTETYQVATTGDVEGVHAPDGGRAPEIDLSDPNKRRASAKTMLVEKLGELDHDTFISVLTEAAANSALCYDTRSEARRRLTLHKKKCATCTSLEVPPPRLAPAFAARGSLPRPEMIQVDENLSGVDSLGNEE